MAVGGGGGRRLCHVVELDGAKQELRVVRLESAAPADMAIEEGNGKGCGGLSSRGNAE